MDSIWISDFDKYLSGRVSDYSTSTRFLSTSTPRGCVLSPLFYSMAPHTHTTVLLSMPLKLLLHLLINTLGLITAMREQACALSQWYQENKSLPQHQQNKEDRGL